MGARAVLLKWDVASTGAGSVWPIHQAPPTSGTWSERGLASPACSLAQQYGLFPLPPEGFYSVYKSGRGWIARIKHFQVGPIRNTREEAARAVDAHLQHMNARDGGSPHPPGEYPYVNFAEDGRRSCDVSVARVSSDPNVVWRVCETTRGCWAAFGRNFFHRTRAEAFACHVRAARAKIEAAIAAEAAARAPPPPPPPPPVMAPREPSRPSTTGSVVGDVTLVSETPSSRSPAHSVGRPDASARALTRADVLAAAAAVARLADGNAVGFDYVLQRKRSRAVRDADASLDLDVTRKRVILPPFETLARWAPPAVPVADPPLAAATAVASDVEGWYVQASNPASVARVVLDAAGARLVLTVFGAHCALEFAGAAHPEAFCVVDANAAGRDGGCVAAGAFRRDVDGVVDGLYLVNALGVTRWVKHF